MVMAINLTWRLEQDETKGETVRLYLGTNVTPEGLKRIQSDYRVMIGPFEHHILNFKFV
jgi:hypothetical protein